MTSQPASINIALTGGIGAGKSTLINQLRCGFPHASFLSMDELVDRLYHDPLWLEWLGEQFGTSDRTQISRLAFADSNILARLNSQSALKIGVQLGRYLQSPGLTFVEFPLLFESGLQDQFDFTVLITASTDVRVQRVVARGRKTAQQALDVIASQMPEEKKAALADLVIDTSVSEALPDHAQKLHQNISAFLNKKVGSL